MYMKRESEISMKVSEVDAVQKNQSFTVVGATSDHTAVDFVNVSSVPALDTPTITNLVLSALEGVQSGVPTRTTATLTPTTLRNIEQLLVAQSVSPPEIHSNQAGFVPPSILTSTANTFVDNKTWGGGIATLNSVADIHSSCNITEMPSVSPSPPEPTPRRAGGRRPTNIERLSPEEEIRRTQRRERNKEAAARCRKRRLDQTNCLQDETDDLEDKKSSLQKEIEVLQRQKDDLEFLLSSHESSCKRNLRMTPSAVVKSEPSGVERLPMDIKYDTTECTLMNKYLSVGLPMTANGKKRCYAQRPTSLAVVPLSKGVSDIGVAIETPSNALKGFGITLDSILESGTGFTPVSTTSGLTPLASSIPMGLSSAMATLNTPVIATTNCGSQLRTTSCEISSPEAGPPKLVSL